MDEIVTGRRPLGGPHVRVLKVSGRRRSRARQLLRLRPASSAAGVFVACGDVTGDGLAGRHHRGRARRRAARARLQPRGRRRRRRSRASSRTTRRSRAGFDVAAADLTGDGVAEIITGAGPAADRTCAPSASRAASSTEVASFFAYDPAFTGGVTVAAADLTGDGVAEIITGAGPRRRAARARLQPVGRHADRRSGELLRLRPGVHRRRPVAAADLTGDGVAEIITGAGPGGGPHVRAFSLAGGTPDGGRELLRLRPGVRSGGVQILAVCAE